MSGANEGKIRAAFGQTDSCYLDNPDQEGLAKRFIEFNLTEKWCEQFERIRLIFNKIWETNRAVYGEPLYDTQEN